MKQAKYIRDGKVIREPTGEVVQTFKSVNQAKKWSRETQMREDGGLGLGSVRVK